MAGEPRYDSQHVTIHWHPESAIIELHWKGFVKGEPFREALNAGLEIILKEGGKGWLADLSQFRVVSSEDQEWTNNDWFPRFMEAGTKRMAIVVPQDVLAKMSVESIMERVEGIDFVSRYFDNLDDAKAWLIDETS